MMMHSYMDKPDNYWVDFVIERRAASTTPPHIAPYKTGSIIDSPSFERQFLKTSDAPDLGAILEHIQMLEERYHPKKQDTMSFTDKEEQRSRNYQQEMQDLQKYMDALIELRQQEHDPMQQALLDQAIDQMTFYKQQMARELAQQQSMPLPSAA
jgi:hypothetical protein